MTFAGVKDIGIIAVRKPEVFQFSVGMDIGFANSLGKVSTGQYVVAIDYGTGEMITGSGYERMSWRKRLKAAWRALRYG